MKNIELQLTLIIFDMPDIILDPKQIYVFEDFSTGEEDYQILEDRLKSLLTNVFGISTTVKSFREDSILSNIPNSDLSFDFRSVVFYSENNNFETVTQTVDAKKGMLVFFAGRTLEYNISSDRNFLIIDHTDTREIF